MPPAEACKVGSFVGVGLCFCREPIVGARHAVPRHRERVESSRFSRLRFTGRIRFGFRYVSATPIGFQEQLVDVR